jgi:transcriptional regulator with XRE-family HTH domain
MDFFSDSLERIKHYLRVSKDQEVAEALGMSKTAFSERKKRGSFPEKELRALAQQRPDLGIDVEYVLHGRASAMALGTASQVGARLRAERLRINWGDADMARHLGCPLAEYIALEEGRRAPTATEAMAIRQHDELDADLVLVGASTKRPSWELSADEQALLALFRAASLPAKTAAIGALQGAAGAPPKRATPKPKPAPHSVQVGSMTNRAAGGVQVGYAGGNVTSTSITKVKKPKG